MNKYPAAMNQPDPREVYYAHKLDSMAGCPEFDRSSIELILNLVYVFDTVEGILTRLFQHSGVSLSACNVLDLLEQQENQCAPLNEIGRLLLVSRANITGLVDSLVKRGLVERLSHPGDRRIKLAHLLPAGRQLLEQRKPLQLGMLRQMCQVLSPQERESMTDLLVRLRHHAQELSQEGS